MKLELNILTERLSIIAEYEKKILLEKQYLKGLIDYQTKVINQMEKDISNLSGIENKLYREIIINGTSISKAIERVSEEENKDVSTLWKNYYPNVKKNIDSLLNIKSKEEIIIKKEEKDETN